MAEYRPEKSPLIATMPTSTPVISRMPVRSRTTCYSLHLPQSPAAKAEHPFSLSQLGVGGMGVREQPTLKGGDFGSLGEGETPGVEVQNREHQGRRLQGEETPTWGRKKPVFP